MGQDQSESSLPAANAQPDHSTWRPAGLSLYTPKRTVGTERPDCMKPPRAIQNHRRADATLGRSALFRFRFKDRHLVNGACFIVGRPFAGLLTLHERA